MTKVYLIRHGEAEGNIYRRAQGQYDGAISAKGLRQIAALAERFRDEHIDALYTSYLRRTVATAGAITKYHALEMRPEPRLREIDLGPWEDKPFGDLLYADPVQMHAFNDDPAAWRVEGAETFPALTKRIRAVVTEGMYVNFYESLKNHFKEKNKPLFPMIHGVVTHLFFISRANVVTDGPIRRIKKMYRPILMLQSRQDTYSVPEFAQVLYDRCPSETKKLVYFPVGAHSRIRINDEQGYDRTVSEFLSSLHL